MKKLVHTVELALFEDEGNGEYGLAHKETHDNPYGSSFNAFWDGTGIFHDVFEHWHEFKHKYFRGEGAMNIGGEMAAMGAMWYYFDTLYVGNRFDFARSNTSPSQRVINTTIFDIQEAIQSGNSSFGQTLVCNVPKQKETDNSELEYAIEKYYESVKGYEFEPNKYTTEDEAETAKNYKESVTFAKIANLHRFGYRLAEKLVPQDCENTQTLRDFIRFWDEFCINNNAEDLHRNFSGLTIKLYKEKGVISWTATLEGRHLETKSLKVKTPYLIDFSDITFFS